MAAGKYKKWLEPENLTLIEGWARAGLSNQQIAKNMGISRDTLNTWCNKYSDISDRMKKGKEVADYEVENALFQRAKGGTITVKKPLKTKTIKYSREGKKLSEKEEVTMTEEEVYIPPDTTACIYWLKHRVPKKWLDKLVMAAEEVTDEEDSSGVIEMPAIFEHPAGEQLE